MTVDLILGDCLEAMRNIPDESIDAMLTDPPYGTNDGKGKTIRRGSSDTNFSVIGWDTELPLDYLSGVYRVLKNNTWGAIFTDNMAISFVWKKLEKVGLSPRNTFYWIKYNKAPTPRANLKSCVETAVLFTKGKTTSKWRGGGNQRNYISMPFVTGDEKVNHPTQKPVSLMKRFITLFTDGGDTIFDPFMGSGTTGVACVQTGRSFVGVEINPDYFTIAERRIKEAQMQMRLDI